MLPGAHLIIALRKFYSDFVYGILGLKSETGRDASGDEVVGSLMDLIISIRQVNQYERGVRFTFGKFTGIMEPGWRLVFVFFRARCLGRAFFFYNTFLAHSKSYIL